VGYIGRLNRLKGVDLLATAFRQLSQTSTNARLLIVGNGEEQSAIRSTLGEECARGIAHIEPAMDQEKLPDWYRAIDLLVMPSRYETMSNSVLEGMACGIPFLASNVGGNKTLGETGAGWLFECGSVSSLFARLIDILQSGSDLKIRGKVGFNYVQSHQSWLSTAERLETIIASRLGVQ
jgi:glycosyltransferase involved in cell wall biosynthesis